ncbi:MAG: adenosylcobalamin-dependent ribonucleoside-diphosphate reductase, partial [Chloroflexi bacterium]|nr:adenosylcobalamin-dependent ribonucleoside-diphosphate reductase [Chloroflexota bacterium]
TLEGGVGQATELSDNARVILEKRYLRKDDDGNFIETPEGLFRRVSSAVADGEQEDVRELWGNRFYDLISSLKFLPNSPTLVNAGTGRGCLSACFVVSPSDDMESIMQVAHDAAMIEKWGGGIGFGFSKLRPKSDQIQTTHGQACGPIAVMKLYSAVGATLTQGAFRLGAHMGQLRDSHPDIREFIHCKDGDDSLQNFNISVQITDAFMRAVDQDAQWELLSPRDTGDGPSNDVVGTVRARDLWKEITESAWKTGDPGVVFMDRVWETAPNPQLGLIETSNPCGEEFLEDYGNCCLGSIDLYKHVGNGGFDWVELEQTVRTAVRFLDDVIEVNTFPLQKLRDVNLATRRIGLGVMGWADALVRLGIPYDTDEALELTDKVAGFIKDTAWDESASLAVERGPFPEYENSALKERGLPPVRNSSVVTIAPTGTISRLAGCSSGIEPHFAIAWWSNVLWDEQGAASSRLLDAPVSVWEALKGPLGDDDSVRELLSQLADNSENAERIMEENGLDAASFRASMAISPEAHVRMQAAWQKHVTNSVSKTINLPNSATVEEVADAYKLAWEIGCKAVTVYRDGSKSMQVLETGKTAKDEDKEADFLVPRQRPASVRGVTERVRTGHGNMFVTINFDEDGRPFEVFTTHGKAGGCDAAHLDGISRLISMALRSNIDPNQVVEHLQGITCCPVWDGGTLVRSAEDAVALVLKKHLTEDEPGTGGQHDITAGSSTAQLEMFSSEGKGKNGNGHRRPIGARCPKCSGSVIHQEGCLTCIDCGYTKCE